MSLPPTFDHVECRVLFASGGWTKAALARRYGVTPSRIHQILDPKVRARANKLSAEWGRAHYKTECRDCGTRIWKRGNDPHYTGLCVTCLGLSRRTAEHGTETRYSSGCRCDLCRKAATEAKRQRRINSRVPCSHGCGRMVDGINRHQPDKPPECRSCSRRRIVAEQRHATQVAA